MVRESTLHIFATLMICVSGTTAIFATHYKRVEELPIKIENTCQNRDIEFTFAYARLGTVLWFGPLQQTIEHGETAFLRDDENNLVKTDDFRLQFYAQALVPHGPEFDGIELDKKKVWRGFNRDNWWDFNGIKMFYIERDIPVTAGYAYLVLSC